ncbi:MAG: hypothetical protein Q7R96_05865 [Nanoarchaeota archaeon]|nr:hypothetical protein [Nanoarchaeota archaeon]
MNNSQYSTDILQKIGTKKLADDFTQPFVIVRITVDRNQPTWWDGLGCRQENDVPLYFNVLGRWPESFGDELIDIYPGQVLVRDGQVHFYDRYPVGGGPYTIDDFGNVDFRRRATLIKENIDQLLGYEKGVSAVYGMQQVSRKELQLPG